jgi:hypothetical protein
MVSVRDYLAKSQNLQQTPENVYEHNTLLLDGTKTEDLNDFLNLASKRVKLANVGNDVLMQIEQDQVKALVDLYSMGLEDPIFMELFLIMYGKWVNALDITRSKNGKERLEQGKVGTTYTNPYMGQGFGPELPQFAVQDPNDPSMQQQNPIQGLLQKMKGMKRGNQ